MIAAKKSRPPAHQWFFPAAALHAALAVPLALAAMRGRGPAALASPLAHGFEMVFGFALALIAGYLLGPQPRARLWLLLVLWLLGRLAHFAAPTSPWFLIASAGFAALLAWQLIPRLLAAKKWRNRTIAPLIGVLCAAAAAFLLAQYADAVTVQRWLLRESVQLLALLMLFMGGRVLAPAVAGEFDRQGRNLEARVQPRLEGALILCVGAAFMLSALPAGARAAGCFLFAAGAIALVRLLRWQLWHCGARPDLICLGAGYGWLALGLAALGWAKLYGAPSSAALHIITVGALGTLSTGIMARVALQRQKRQPQREPRIVVMTALIGLAALARVAGGMGLLPGVLLPLAAAAWSGSFLLLAYLLGQAHRGAVRSRRAEY